MNIVIQFLPLLAGIGLFLYGMNLLGKSLENLAGAKMEKTLEKLTDNVFKGVALGTLVTAVIQSSSATTIMVIGLLNAGIFKLYQALPLIMGANIGTTVTGQLLRLGDISSSNWFLSLMKPSSFGPILIIIGACLIMFSKKHSRKTWGNLLIGLGMLFFGMTTMEKTLSPLGEEAWFRQMLGMFQNPFIGILIGALMTAVLQSSSASIGILQALSATGSITWSSAIPLILGQNIGKCVTVMMAAIGNGKQAKRAVFLHVFINFIGLVLFVLGIYGANLFMNFTFWSVPVNRGNIADFHTIFSIVTVLVLMPFTKWLGAVAEKLIPADEMDEESNELDQQLNSLDDLLIKTPSVAINQARKMVILMGETALKALELTEELHVNYSDEIRGRLDKLEDFMDRAENALNNYILKITPHRLTDAESNLCTEMLHSITNFERIGDHCVNLQDVAKYDYENGITYSESGLKELHIIFAATREILDSTIRMYENNSAPDATHILPFEDMIDEMQETLKDRHIERLRLGLCSVTTGVSFLEILTNIERISDHCANIAKNILQMNSKEVTRFAFHQDYLSGPRLEDSPEYKAYKTLYQTSFALPKEYLNSGASEAEFEAADEMVPMNMQETVKEESVASAESAVVETLTETALDPVESEAISTPIPAKKEKSHKEKKVEKRCHSEKAKEEKKKKK